MAGIILTAFAVSFGLTGFAPADPWGERDVEKAFEEHLLADWIRQDWGRDPADVFSSADSSDAEKGMVEKVLHEIGEFDEAVPPEFAERFSALSADRVPGNDSRWLDLYRSACRERRMRRLAVIAEETPEIIFTKHYIMGASHYAYTEDVSDEAYQDFSVDRKPGGQLCRLTVRPDGTTETAVLNEVPDGTIRDPDVSYDGKRILFSMRRSFTEDDFHLYEYSVETKEVRQLTFGPGVADIEPAYLPNGDIIFDSTRGIQLTDCWWTEVSNLFTCDGEGRFLRRLSFDQVTVNYPKVMDDGRVTYTRWDYNDRGHIFPQPLFVMNPDGTGQTEFYGNNSFFPTSILHARGIPHSGGKVLAVAAGHHTYQHGKLILIDRTQGTQENQGVTLVAPVRPTPAERIDRYGQEGEQFAYPFALNENDFIVAYLPPGRNWENPYPTPFGVYYCDIDGRRELLAFDPAISCSQPVPLAEREIPAPRPSMVDYSEKTGRYYVQNVYEGPGLAGVEPGTVKAIRIVSLLYRPSAIGNNWNWGEAGDSNVSMPISVGNGTWDAKKVIGEVPVEEDGSAYFEVPAMTPVYFQMLDENRDVVQTMRSWSTLQPGELFACVGCHEPKGEIVANVGGQSATTAIQKRPSVPEPPYEPGPGEYQNAGFSYVRDIQPILDEHCVSCHSGEAGSSVFSLTGDLYRVPEGDSFLMGSRQFSQSYLRLTSWGSKTPDFIHWPDIHSPPFMMKAPIAGAADSPLIQRLRGDWDENHKEVKLTETEIRKIALWIDLFVPFCGTYDEANTWSKKEKAHYAYYEMKREKSSELIAKNIAALIAVRRGERSLPSPDEFDQFRDGGRDYKKKFLKDWTERRLPARTKKTGPANVERNLALNPDDTQGVDPAAYPHAWTNSEFAYLDVNAAKNLLDGEPAGSETTISESISETSESNLADEKKRGGDSPAWRPNFRRDLFLQVDLGHAAEIDRVVVTFSLDRPDDDVWKSGTLEFSDGSKVDVAFEKTDTGQVFHFDKRTSDFVRLTNLKSERLADRKGIAEFEVWGVSAE